jgi:hypothetical protein
VTLLQWLLIVQFVNSRCLLVRTCVPFRNVLHVWRSGTADINGTPSDRRCGESRARSPLWPEPATKASRTPATAGGRSTRYATGRQFKVSLGSAHTANAHWSPPLAHLSFPAESARSRPVRSRHLRSIGWSSCDPPVHFCLWRLFVVVRRQIVCLAASCVPVLWAIAVSGYVATVVVIAVWHRSSVCATSDR